MRFVWSLQSTCHKEQINPRVFIRVFEWLFSDTSSKSEQVGGDFDQFLSIRSLLSDSKPRLAFATNRNCEFS